jgi:secreted trypsin-like serine protease
MKAVSVVTCLGVSLGCVWAAKVSHGQPAPSVQEAIKANPQAAAIARGQARIVGGDPVEIANHPWQVALIRSVPAEPTRSQFCGGSVIADSWILTAAHCIRSSVVREDPARLHVVVGTSQFFVGGERIPVAALHVHPQYNTTTNDFDFALLRLARPVAMGAGAVTRPIEPAGASAQIADGAKAFVSGWGATSEGGPGSLDLLGVEVPVVSTSVCNRPESYNGDITANMLCAGRETGGVDSCQGDSGGPLTAADAGRTILVGVVSFGQGCARKLKYGVYSRVPVAAGWIATTTAGK